MPVRKSSMRKWVVTGIASLAGLAGWQSPANAEWLSATGRIIAVLADDLFLGEAEGHLSGAGTLAIYAQKNPALRCRGQFTSSAALGGSGQLRCSDGATATFQFQRLSVFRGYGVGSFSRGAMSFAYGLAAHEAGPYLKLPEGKQLKHNGTELELIDR